MECLVICRLDGALITPKLLRRVLYVDDWGLVDSELVLDY